MSRCRSVEKLLLLKRQKPRGKGTQQVADDKQGSAMGGAYFADRARSRMGAVMHGSMFASGLSQTELQSIPILNGAESGSNPEDEDTEGTTSAPAVGSVAATADVFMPSGSVSGPCGDQDDPVAPEDWLAVANTLLVGANELLG